LTRKYRHDAVVSIAGRSLVWKILKLTRPEIHKFIKTVQKTVATVDHLYTVDHVKFLMHLRLYSMLHHNHWGPHRLMAL